MLSYIIRRLVYMVVLLVMLSVATFIIIQLPPGDYLTTLVANMRRANVVLSEEALAVLTERYGLGRPLHIQYLTWFGNLLKGDMGESFIWEAPVTEIVGDRLALTVTLSISTLITLAVSPWLLIPALFVVVTVLCFNFLGDGLRDATDPYRST